jgi:hypothetical protein
MRSSGAALCRGCLHYHSAPSSPQLRAEFGKHQRPRRVLTRIWLPPSTSDDHLHHLQTITVFLPATLAPDLYRPVPQWRARRDHSGGKPSSAARSSHRDPHGHLRAQPIELAPVGRAFDCVHTAADCIDFIWGIASGPLPFRSPHYLHPRASDSVPASPAPATSLLARS